ncbi:MAG: acetyl-CoA carboxylase biotin carboxylase subunit, partial [Armatimonadetes bacterium]|nr:acetyl-CoA carboxylase biotin carboxylase subunit [Anaerolineae bacterium]
PVTELVTGIDLVKLQFRIASGEVLPFTQADVRQRGHAIECRVYAEDPHNNFLPSTGTVHTFIAPQMPNVRVDTYLQSSDAISIHYDPMIAKIIAYDTTREAAIAKLQQALRATVVLGVTTNLDFLQALLAHPVFAAGQIHTAYLDEHLADVLPPLLEVSIAALIAAALSEQRAIVLPLIKAAQDGDAYSPWAHADGFRLGGR